MQPSTRCRPNRNKQPEPLYSIHARGNRLVSFSDGSVTASFVYDGDGNRVRGIVNGVSTAYLGNYVEYAGSTLTKYYYAGGQRIAMNRGGTLFYLAGDHLGSSTRTADISGGSAERQQQRPLSGKRDDILYFPLLGRNCLGLLGLSGDTIRLEHLASLVYFQIPYNE